MVQKSQGQPPDLYETHVNNVIYVQFFHINWLADLFPIKSVYSSVFFFRVKLMLWGFAFKI